MKSNKFSFLQRLKSFSYAFNGLKILIKNEHNSRIHFSVGAITLVVGIIVDLQIWEWVAICIVTALVIIFEILNSVIARIIHQ